MAQCRSIKQGWHMKARDNCSFFGSSNWNRKVFKEIECGASIKYHPYACLSYMSMVLTQPSINFGLKIMARDWLNMSVETRHITGILNLHGSACAILNLWISTLIDRESLYSWTRELPPKCSTLLFFHQNLLLKSGKEETSSSSTKLIWGFYIL